MPPAEVTTLPSGSPIRSSCAQRAAVGVELLARARARSCASGPWGRSAAPGRRVRNGPLRVAGRSGTSACDRFSVVCRTASPRGSSSERSGDAQDADHILARRHQVVAARVGSARRAARRSPVAGRRRARGAGSSGRATVVRPAPRAGAAAGTAARPRPCTSATSAPVRSTTASAASGGAGLGGPALRLGQRRAGGDRDDRPGQLARVDQRQPAATRPVPDRLAGALPQGDARPGA